MRFAEVQDLVEQFGERELIQATDRTNRPPSTIDQVVVGQALDQASSLVEGYLRKRYTLPLPATPPALVKATADIARYYLRSESAEKDGAVLRGFEQAVKWLKDISAGNVELQLPPGSPEAEPAGGGAVRSTSGDRTFTGSTLKGYV